MAIVPIQQPEAAQEEPPQVEYATVYFSSARSWRWRDCTSIRQGAKLVYYSLLGAAIRLASGSKLVHVGIGYGGAVLDAGLRGHRFVPEAAYEDRHQVEFVREVCIDSPIDMRRVEGGRNSGIIRLAVRWISRGRIHADDCVTITAALLRSSGVSVPRQVHTPEQLCSCLHGT